MLAYPPGVLYNDAMKKILFIGTGGTVASSSTTDGLAPSIQAEELLRDLQGPAKACEITPMQVLNLDSTDMTPADWLLIARTIEVHYDAYDGFVIAHGTDTMAYTAAALSYLIRRSPKPVVLTGAQKPIHSDNTDSRVNLQDAFAYACAPGSCGVVIVFNGAVILGTRARKVRSKSFSAFSSIFSEKSVATKCLHLCASPSVSSPVPHAHSSTSSAREISASTYAQSTLCAFLFQISANRS